MTSMNKNDALLILRDAIFFEDYILYRKNGDKVIILEENIESINYSKPTLFRYFLAATSRGYLTPGYLWIEAKVQFQEKKKLKKRIYGIKIKYEEVFNLPKKFQPIGWCE